MSDKTMLQKDLAAVTEMMFRLLSGIGAPDQTFEQYKAADPAFVKETGIWWDAVDNIMRLEDNRAAVVRFGALPDAQVVKLTKYNTAARARTAAADQLEVTVNQLRLDVSTLGDERIADLGLSTVVAHALKNIGLTKEELLQRPAYHASGKGPNATWDARKPLTLAVA